MPNHSIVFLMYHELEVPGRTLCESEPGYARYVLPEDNFRSQMEYLKGRGWQGLSVGQALEFAAGNNVAITFDDGCETDLISAAPLLRQAGFNATFYVTTGRLGKSGYLSYPQLRELRQQGFEIGCHSMTHAYLPDLDENGMRHEIWEAKSELEQILGHPVEHFSCPGGRWDERVLHVARSAGYRTVANSRIQANAGNTDPYRLGRVAMLRDFSVNSFAGICDGSKLSRMRAESSILQAAKQIMGNAFYDRVRSLMLRG